VGYNLTITKKEHPFSEEGDQISQTEWLDYVDKHAHLQISKDMTPSSDSEYVVWDDSKCWLSWSNDGSIDSKNPDCEFIERMISIADGLGAKVLGEESEQYLAHDSGYIMDGERGRYLADRSQKKNESGIVRYEYIQLDEPTRKPSSKEDAEKLREIEKEMQKVAAVKKSKNRPWWKFW